MRTSRILAVAIAIASLSVVMAAGFTAPWLTRELRVLGLVMLPAAVASLLVLYFDWRATLRHRMLAERRDDIVDPDQAA